MNVFKMMQQASSMQKDIKAMQKSLAGQIVEFKNGDVTAIARGDMTIESIKIDPRALKATQTGPLEKSIVAAVNGALESAKSKAGEEMAKITKGMGLEGLLGGGE
jgi:DNA-binding YbaB/EbfC family protein